MITYRIRNWSDNFENNRTRDLKKMDWIPIPNKHDGDGYTELLDHPNGMAHYGAWLLIVQVASKCVPRGTLSRDGAAIPQEGAAGVKKPHDAASLARVTRGVTKIFEEAIPRLLAIGWLEVIPCDQVTSENPAGRCGETAGKCGEVPMEGKGREGKGKEVADARSFPDDDDEGVSPAQRSLLDVDEYGLDIPQHLRSERFQAQWREWIDYRKKVKKSKDWVRLFQRQLEWLAQYPADTAMGILSKSLINEYQGLFPPGSNGQAEKAKKSKGPNI